MNRATPPPAPDVVILGAGVIGLCCAYELLRAGRRVTVLEARAVGAGSSHGNCGTITPSHAPLNAPGTFAQALRWMLQADAPLYLRPSLAPARWAWLLRFAARCNERHFAHVLRYKTPLMLAAREAIEQLVAQAQLDCEFEPSGTLYVWKDAAAFAAGQRIADAMAAAGVPVETLTGEQARAKEPALNDAIVGAHYHPGDARLRPERYVAELARAVRELGGEILEGETVGGFEGDGDRLRTVITQRAGGEQRRHAATELVLALGAWSPRLARRLRLALPIEPGKGYSITYARPALAPKIPLVLKERGVCVTAWGSGFRLGSTMEFSGYDETLNRRRLQALRHGAAEYLRQPEGPRVVEEWFGWRPMTYDDLPIIGRAPGWRNLTLATGHGMLGVSLSAITGRLVAELIAGRAPSMDLEPFSPARFA